jgi:hypothetical protein
VFLARTSRHYDVWNAEFMWASAEPVIRNTVAISSGYFALDLLLCLYAKEIRTTDNIVHHGTCWAAAV